MNLNPLLVFVLLVAGVPPLAAQTAPAKPAPVEWGTPIGAVPPAPSASAPSASTEAPAVAAPASGAVKSAPSAFATARATSTATGDYFHDFAELIVRVRSVKWIEEICSETFPATAETNAHAYADWLVDHGAFVDEMEAQFVLIDKYWGQASAQAKKEGLTVDQLRARVDSNRAGLRKDFHAKGSASFQRRCEAYPEVLLSPQLDLDKSQSDYVASVRLGPR
jgi:hypothetical protein